MRFFHVTVATMPDMVLEALKRKVAMANEGELIVLGTQENRPIGWRSYQNFGCKLKYFYEFICRPDLGDKDIVLYTDAYDVAFFGSSQKEILERFIAMEIPILFGSEAYCFPDPAMARMYFRRDDTDEFPFLNSGLFIGYVWAFRHCMRGYKYDDMDNDQLYWTNTFLKSHNEYGENTLITLDYENRLFLNTAGIDETEIEVDHDNNKIWYNGSQPLFIHVNGIDKQFIGKCI